MLGGMSIKMMVDCPECKTANPLTEASNDFACYACHASFKTKKIWSEIILSVDIMAELFSFKEHEGRSSNIMGVYNCEMEYGRLFPCCPACKKTFSETEIRQAGEDGASGLVCSGCGVSVSFRKAPGWISDIAPPVLYLVGESADSDGERKGIGPVVFKCMSCGGNLKADGSDRVVTCEYCNSSNYLPDDLWSRIHPTPVRKRFFAVFDPEYEDPKYLKKMYNEDDDLACKAARRKDLGGVALGILAAHESDEVRACVARRKDLPAGLYEKLARDNDYDVRKAVASRTDLPEELALVLASDRDSDVKEKLAKNPGISLEVMKRLAANDYYGTRETMAKRKPLPAEVGMMLAEDRDDDVRKALAANPTVSGEALARLAQGLDTSYDNSLVRLVAENPACPTEVLQKFYRIKELRPLLKKHPNYAEPGFFRKLFS